MMMMTFLYTQMPASDEATCIFRITLTIAQSFQSESQFATHDQIK